MAAPHAFRPGRPTRRTSARSRRSPPRSGCPRCGDDRPPRASTRTCTTQQLGRLRRHWCRGDGEGTALAISISTGMSWRRRGVPAIGMTVAQPGAEDSAGESAVPPDVPSPSTIGQVADAPPLQLSRAFARVSPTDKRFHHGGHDVFHQPGLCIKSSCCQFRSDVRAQGRWSAPRPTRDPSSSRRTCRSSIRRRSCRRSRRSGCRAKRTSSACRRSSATRAISKKSLDESEEIIRRLDKAMTGPARVNVFPELAAARAKSIAVSNEISRGQGVAGGQDVAAHRQRRRGRVGAQGARAGA